MSRSSRNSRNADLESLSFSDFREGAEGEIPFHLARPARVDDPNQKSIDSQAQVRRLGREHAYSLHEHDLETLADIGCFRAVELDDLAHHRYSGDPGKAQEAIGSLSRAGLLRSRLRYPERVVFLTLTPTGHRLLVKRLQRSHSDQKLYHGFARIREARHDAALYRLYHQESSRIERMGGRVRRIILDFELRHSINRRLAKLHALSWAERIDQKQKIAQEQGLRVVNGRIPLPDLRLEYEGPDQQISKVDLELVTETYQRGDLALKTKAGFAIYAFAGDLARLRPAMQDPEIMLDILSL